MMSSVKIKVTKSDSIDPKSYIPEFGEVIVVRDEDNVNHVKLGNGYNTIDELSNSFTTKDFDKKMELLKKIPLIHSMGLTMDDVKLCEKCIIESMLSKETSLRYQTKVLDSQLDKIISIKSEGGVSIYNESEY